MVGIEFGASFSTMRPAGHTFGAFQPTPSHFIPADGLSFYLATARHFRSLGPFYPCKAYGGACEFWGRIEGKARKDELITQILRF